MNEIVAQTENTQGGRLFDDLTFEPVVPVLVGSELVMTNRNLIDQHQALEAWVNKGGKSTTRKNYLRTARKLEFYSQRVVKKGLRDWFVQDANGFIEFMGSPTLSESETTVEVRSENGKVSRVCLFPSTPSASSLSQYITEFKGCAKFLAGIGYLSFDPTEGTKKLGNKADRQVPQDRVIQYKYLKHLVPLAEQLLTEGDERDVKSALAFLLMRYSGVRRVELIDLQYKNIKLDIDAMEDPDDDEVKAREPGYLIEVEEGKGGTYRLIDANDALLAAIDKYKARIQTLNAQKTTRSRLKSEQLSSMFEPESYILSQTGKSAFGRPYSNAALGKLFKHFLSLAESLFDDEGDKQIVRDFSPHMCRHTYATLLVKSGMPLEEVQYQLGHRNLNTTIRYLGYRAMRQFRNA